MVIISSIRAPLPAAESAQSQMAEACRQIVPQGETTGPRSRPEESKPVLRLPAKPAANDARFFAAPGLAEISATQAAEAAREAYIKASIAAGLSPLPLI